MNHLFIAALFLIIPFSAIAGDAEAHNDSFTAILLIILLMSGIAGSVFWFYKKETEGGLPQQESPFSEQRITQTFISALSNLTRELNLEIATSWQMEVFERTDASTFWGISFGTNSAEIRVPATYRYHIRLDDEWKLEIKNKTVLVHAPKIRASQPPAIHTDQMQFRVQRGWGRFAPNELLESLHRDLTPTLCRHADDPRRIGCIRESARVSVAGFVRLWLDRERRWHSKAFTEIQVKFADEQSLDHYPLERRAPARRSNEQTRTTASRVPNKKGGAKPPFSFWNSLGFLSRDFI